MKSKYITHPASLVFPRVTYTEGIPDRIHSGYIQYTYTKLHRLYNKCFAINTSVFIARSSNQIIIFVLQAATVVDPTIARPQLSRRQEKLTVESP